MPSLANLGLILAVVVTIAGGQALFKLTAERLPQGAPIWHAIQDPVLYAAGIVYAGATVLWVIALRSVPLTAAYPFVALTFVLVPLIGILLFKENVSWSYWAGVGLIVIGVVLTQRAL